MNYEKCELCPRKCGINRNISRGFCKGGALASVTRAAKHFWEEPVISGEKGSGTVFFSNCNLMCVYCQNKKISSGGFGKEISVKRLSEIFLSLQDKGAHNINLVTPTHYLPHIVQALEKAKSKGLDIPIVYNTSGYEKPESIRLLDGLVDIYLPDFKYYSPELSSNGQLLWNMMLAAVYPNSAFGIRPYHMGSQSANLLYGDGRVETETKSTIQSWIGNASEKTNHFQLK